MGMVGNDMGKFMQYQTAQAIPKFAEGSGNGGGGIAGDAMGLGAGVALGQVLAQNLSQGLNQNQNAQATSAPVVAVVSAADVMTTLEKLGELKTTGILTQEEFDAKKAELLKKLT
jgi:membrane protease subunit (stomatin/prohibitin family)